MVAWISLTLSVLTSELVNIVSVFVVVPTCTSAMCSGMLAAGLAVVGVAVGDATGVAVPLPLAGVLVLVGLAVAVAVACTVGVAPTVGAVAFDTFVVLGRLLSRLRISLAPGKAPVV